ncbi:uncharacterized protein LOC131438898 [Malaya genurostris]|uniref:uncharacterized protein LOC131438898 n=1 Tax=Malaya genurostris TaxID=325434 RepID=UPI0026F3853E|nr:uncharacterized protein LOC131438898 [Malaya genurostris]
MSESATPRLPSSEIQRRNILDALTGSHIKQDDVVDRIPTVAQQKASQQALITERRMAQSLEVLLDRQALLTEKLLRMRDTLQEETISVHLLKLHVETLRRTADEFEKVYSEIIPLLAKERRAATRIEYSNFELIHNDIYVTLQTRIEQLDQQSKVQGCRNIPSTVSSLAPVAPVYVQAPAPHLQAPFPTFNGTLDNWYSFKCLFQSIMARYTNETDAMKILHLRNSLTGEAKDKIDQEVVNNSDYATAWKILEDAYEDKRLIMDTHIDAILECQKITKDNRSRSLSKMVELCVKHTDALKGHGFPVVGLAELILVNVLYKKLDKETQEQWETRLGNDELPDFHEFIDFLRERGRILQRTSRSQQVLGHQAAICPNKRQPVNPKSHLPSNSFVQIAKEICPCCKSEHSIYKCEKFKALPLSERKAFVFKVKLCFNCLKSKHQVNKCPSEQGCKIQGCGRKHHSLLHGNDSSNTANSGKEENGEIHETESNDQSQKQQTAPDNRNCATSLCANSSGFRHQVILSTAQVLVHGRGDSLVKCRALLDSGSDSNIISEKLAAKLNLRMTSVDFPISGLNNIETRVKHQLATSFHSCNNPFESKIMDFLVVPRVTSNLPIFKIDSRSWSIPAGIRFADPLFYSPGEVDMIIGNEVFFDLVKRGRLKLGDDGITLAETELGWVVAGLVPIKTTVSQRHMYQLNRSQESLNQTMSKFWELENVYTENSLTADETIVEQHFETTHYREVSGRYVVRLPFNGMEGQLGDSYDAARKRLDKLMVQLAKNPVKQNEYYNFLSEYLSLGHMTETVGCTDGGGYYIPHHAVYKASSSTTKTRVVFDASAKTTTGLSLNDTLLVGPTVQNDIVSIILRFCIHQVVLTADISKMYRQVKLYKDDCKYQRILWWNSDGHLKTYELQTVTYGVASSPHHATRVLLQLAVDEGADLPLAGRIIVEDSYIDDFLTGGSSIEEVIRIYSELTELLRRGGFEVHKFCSNSVDVLNSIPTELQEKQVSFDESGISNSIKTLGLIWNPQDDYFMFRTNPFDWQKVPTKRKVLSEIGQLFDPLGFLGPIIVYAKLVMQDIWRLGLDWDQELPAELLDKWKQFRQQLTAVNQIQKPRCVVNDRASTLELHGFSDASKRAYGAVVYIRCITKEGTINVSLVASKSRVAPLKPTTIPRLELCGAKLLAELVLKVISAIKIRFDGVQLWCDSQIVLCWLRKSPHSFNQFVANRVAAIVEMTHGYQWSYIRSEHNPADVISRGLLPNELLHNKQWWCGAPLLSEENPVSYELEPLDESNIPEVRSAVVLTEIRSKPAIVLDRLSSYKRILRAWVYVHRYIELKVFKRQKFGEITSDEIREAERSILLLVQHEVFSDARKVLNSNSNQRIPFPNLALFISEDGLIRVGGRLKHSAIPYDSKHQILLPQKHHITEIITRELHHEYFHVGQNGLLAIVRQHYWPIHAKQVIKKIVSSCQVCARQRPVLGVQYMGNLPEVRVNPSPPFSKVGIDYAGPFMLKLGGRSTKLYKGYVVVFVCMVVKAIHLELVSNLSTDQFIAALQRFSSRRGLPSDIHSDNATTFVGAHHELAALRQMFEDQQHQIKLGEYCSSKGIRWHFIPPRSPHFGGIWEAGVKSMKYHLKRVVGETRLTFEEMSTFLAQTEAILNSRPLCPMSDDPSDYSVLTPSHFLIGRSGVALPVPSYKDEKVGRLNRYQHLQLMNQHFWSKWSREYLHHLQGRQKWNKKVNQNYKVGSLVLLVEKNLPSQHWKRGRIVALHPGDDNIVRVVVVKTASGEYKRAITEIALMPSVETELSTGGE